MEVCNGSVQWKCAMEVCNGSVQWKCAMEIRISTQRKWLTLMGFRNSSTDLLLHLCSHILYVIIIMNATRIILKWSSYSSHYTAVHASLCICSVGARAEMPATIFLMMVERRAGHFGWLAA